MSVNPVQEVVTNECWRLLRTTTVGRLAVCIDNRPDIFPINYVVDHGTLVFRTAPGTKLTAALAAETVAVEADGIEGTRAWSVVIKGRAQEVIGLHPLLETVELPLFPWHHGPKHRFVRVTPSELTGRAFIVADPAQWANPLSSSPHAPAE